MTTIQAATSIHPNSHISYIVCMRVCSPTQVFIWLFPLLHFTYATRSRHPTAHRRISGQRQCAVKRARTHTQTHIKHELSRQRLNKYRHLCNAEYNTMVASKK